MAYTIYQHWDPLTLCIVGRTYPPEFYSWIENPRLRNLFEKIARETEEDLQGIVEFLQKFGVEVLRPNLPDSVMIDGKYVKPPMTPRDYIGVIGETLYYNESFIYSKANDFKRIYNDIRGTAWPDCESFAEFKKLPDHIRNECLTDFDLMGLLRPTKKLIPEAGCYEDIIKKVVDQGNTFKKNIFKKIENDVANPAMITSLGKDLFFGTTSTGQDQVKLLNLINNEFKNTRNHIINTGGHIDGCVVPVCPGLVFIRDDMQVDVNQLFPGWEVIYLPVPTQTIEFKMKTKINGKWWIPGHEHDQALIKIVDTYFDNWVGFVEETVFDLNFLILDSKNILAPNCHSDVVEKTLNRYGINLHVLPLRHRYFWDGGIHCMTSDLNRVGVVNDFFS